MTHRTVGADLTPSKISSNSALQHRVKPGEPNEHPWLHAVSVLALSIVGALRVVVTLVGGTAAPTLAIAISVICLVRGPRVATLAVVALVVGVVALAVIALVIGAVAWVIGVVTTGRHPSVHVLTLAAITLIS